MGWDGGYRDYRDCLRWDFGFTCAFCLLHESDLVEHGAERTGLTWVEHRELQSTAKHQANDYANCLYSCRYCNSARKAQPIVDPSGRQLLDPTVVAWASRFSRSEGGSLAARPGDADAAYTWEAYDLDEPRKVTIRNDREREILKCLNWLREGTEHIPKLQAMAERLRLSQEPGAGEELSEIRSVIDGYRQRVTVAVLALERYQAVPIDAPTRCRCKKPPAYNLMPQLAQQLIDVIVAA